MPDTHQLPIDRILEGDCLDVPASLPENSIDLVFAGSPCALA